MKTLPRAKSSQSTRTSSSVCLTQSPGLFTWDELLPRAREARGGGVYYDDLPSPFKDGLIWLDTGADNVRVYVFEKNLCPPITKERFSRNNNYDVVEKHVMSGQALEFVYSGRNNDPNVRREFTVRRGGYRTCILTTCLTAKSLTQQQIVKILRSARRGN